MSSVKSYLDKVGAFTVEQVPCPHFSEPVNLDGPRTGVIHTTEGDSVEGALSVFRTHYAPHFLVGPGRVLQLVQVGTIGAALVTHNVDAIVQIEVVGFSKQAPWIFDEATLAPLAALLAACQAEYGIPLTHPWPDGDYGRYGDNPHRHAGRWGVVGGWYGHGDVPVPDEHWDPGDLQWSALLARAAALTEIASAPASPPPQAPPRPCACHPLPIMPPAAPGAYEPSSDAVWARAAQFVNAMRSRGFDNPATIGGLANVYAESRLRSDIKGDQGSAVNIVQWHGDRAARILNGDPAKGLAGCGIDVTTESSIAKLVEAIVWELTHVYPATLAKLKAATTAEDAARIWCAEYEGAGAAGAPERRADFASYFAAWASQNAAFLAANPAA